MAEPAQHSRKFSAKTNNDQGWQLLVGGKENAIMKGGANPFDIDASDEKVSAMAFKTNVTEPKVIEIIALGDQIRHVPYIFSADESMLTEGAEAVFGDGREGEPGIISTLPAESDSSDAPEGTSHLAAPETPEDTPFETSALDEVEEWVDESRPSYFENEPAADSSPSVAASRVGIDDPFSKDQTTIPSEINIEDAPANQEKGTLVISEERVMQLATALEEAYEEVVTEVRGDYDLTDDLLEKLRQARMYLSSDFSYYDEAEKLIYGVKSRLSQEAKVRKWSRTGGTLITLYLVIWLVLIGLGMVVSDRTMMLANTMVPEWMAAMYLPTLFGGLGGVVGALWVLIKHTTQERDFDPIHSAWYLTNPLMGLLLGMVAYLVTWGGGNVLTLITSGTANSITLSTVSPAIYPLCLVVGFNQNVLWNLVDKFIKAIVPDENDTGA